MDTLVNRLLNADVVKIFKISGDYKVDPSEAGIPPDSFSSPNDLSPNDLCVPKNSGTLAFTLTPDEFGFQAIPLTLHLKGAEGKDMNGNPLVQWSVNQTVNLYVKDLDITIDKIEGQLTTKVSSFGPAQDTSCGGSCHAFNVLFGTIGSDNWIAIKGHKNIVGIDKDVSLLITNLTLNGLSAEPVPLTVHIHYAKNSECGIGAVEGEIARFWADVSGVPDGVTETYQWKVSGANQSPNSRNDIDTFKVEVPSPPNPFTVSVSVSLPDLACTSFSRITVVPLTFAAATRIEHLCKLIMNYTLINMFFNPLGPDVTIPLSERNVKEIHRAAKQVVELTGSLLSLYETGTNKGGDGL